MSLITLRTILNEMRLLTESVSEDEVKSAIDKHRRVYIDYQSPIKSDETNATASGNRKIEVYAYGLTKSGNPVIRAFQNSGPTTSKVPEWKFFRLDGIKSWQETDEYFDTPISDVYPSLGKFNDSGDRTMSVVYMIANFDNKSKPISVNDIHGRMNNNDVYKTDTERRMEKLRQQLDNNKKNSDNKETVTKQQQPDVYKTDTEKQMEKLRQQLDNPQKIDLNQQNNVKNQPAENDNTVKKPEYEIYKTDSERQMEKLKQQMQNVQKIDLSKIPKR